MEPSEEGRREAAAPDWRHAESYQYTTELPRLAWAWEFLRRNPKYRAEWEAETAGKDPVRTRRRLPPALGTVVLLELPAASGMWDLVFL
jgi:hypothetical protein